jgi:predicted Zn finger-like uncharacterized protein
MTVECENCNTRFHVADARIPAKGARARCSRCHHRFNIRPPPAPPTPPSASIEVSAVEAVLVGEAALEEDQLDNPEFLFDNLDTGAGKPARAGLPAGEASATRMEQPQPAEPPEPETLTACPVEFVVKSAGMTAQEMLDSISPELPTGRFELAGPRGNIDLEIGRLDKGIATSAQPYLSGEVVETSAPLAPVLEDHAETASKITEDEESSFADWDPIATLSAPPDGELKDEAAAIPSPATSPPALQPIRSQPTAKAKRREALETQDIDLEAAGPEALVLRIAAALVGLALLGAAGRLLWLQRGSASPPPEIVQAAGWIAADLETFLARNATGERVVIVRGNLFPDGSAPPPRVEVRLLDSAGQPLVESPPTWLDRIDDAEVAPDRLALRLVAAGGEIGAIGQLVTGFTAIFPSPPANVRSVEVSLQSRPGPPTGTATAVAQPEPSAEAPALKIPAPSQTKSRRKPSSADTVPAAPKRK